MNYQLEHLCTCLKIRTSEARDPEQDVGTGGRVDPGVCVLLRYWCVGSPTPHQQALFGSSGREIEHFGKSLEDETTGGVRGSIHLLKLGHPGRGERLDEDGEATRTWSRRYLQYAVTSRQLSVPGRINARAPSHAL